MRVLCALGAIVFLYLALIPAGLVASTLDSACAGEACETSVLSRVGFTALYGLCLVALLGSALLFANHAIRLDGRSGERLVRSLALTGAVVGITLFVLFFVAFPLGGLVALGVAGVVYYALFRLRERDRGPDPSGNGHRPGGLRTGRLAGRTPR